VINGQAMNILRTIECFYPSVTGPTTQAFRISSELEKRGIRSPILTTYLDVEGSLPSEDRFESVHVKRFKNQLRVMRYCVSLGMLSHLKDFDIIHSHSYRSFQSDLGFLAAKTKGKPFVINTHGTLLSYRYILKNPLYSLPYVAYDLLTLKSSARRADVVVVSSRQEYKEAIAFGIPRAKVRLVPVGIDIESYQPRHGEPHDKLRLLFVGRISRNRNLDPILRALNYVKRVRLFIVGGEMRSSGLLKGEYLDELKRLALEWGVEGKVTFVGPVYGQEPLQYYNKCDIFIYTSKYESFGQTILEAAAASLPVISTPVGVANEIVVDGETGFLINEEPEMIASAVHELFDINASRQMGESIRNIVQRDYNWNNITERYINIYQASGAKTVHRKSKTTKGGMDCRSSTKGSSMKRRIEMIGIKLSPMAF